ncbi:sortilin-related receptor-like isoform X1 [Vanessa atalanta]|uniref:sortilin-related receptor-like isoform X1 n=1 Tax=Vanessa atalanta TaxID=42275 RepID=UPI001FCE1AA2|nr:sortilin-related receptor-like isoform X1 [Vanessa atalanta]XP_047534156.1 sortilin-related receptor-like isoform X1 [Vanessa atalanta]
MLPALGFKISFIAVVNIISCVLGVQHYDYPAVNLYVAEPHNNHNQKITVINRITEENTSAALERKKRDASTTPPPTLETHKNISSWTTHLNDGHQQLMVHWVGEGSDVIICLARDSTSRNKGVASSSALYISYDYGKNFTNKTEVFRLGDDADSGYAQLDKFFNHPKYPEFCVFVDSTNKKLYYTQDNGRTIHRSDLSFHPSELAFDEEIPNRYVILDKVNSTRNLYMTLDGGKTFKMIQSYVKMFFWPSGPGFSKIFYVERWKPGGNSTVLSVNDPTNMANAHELFTDAKDFQIKGDFMFATKQSKEKNSLDLYISHQRGPFFKAEFQTELDLSKFHIADVTDKRIFVSVMHTENLANLYVSEISRNFTQYNFVLSLEHILSYFPDGNWKDSWLEDVTEDPFTDLYRVEGLKGIYIASKVNFKTQASNIEPEHLVSLITFDHGVTWSPIKPPTEDENGKPLNCHIENSCRLHLCQKFSQLYPVTSQPGKVINTDMRSASIMSSKSVPGVIMATGVLGKSLKGIPGVYLSRDAGLTWKRILKDYYFFNYGDHGGVLVAVKYFKSRGETRRILYSTNEGLEWNSYEFNSDDLRIYGLMTEPGENTTTFTMFGSENAQHQWIIITIDLLNTFPRNCTEDDYKFWSLTSPNSTVSCVLGTRDTFQRRLAHTNCYNGVGYERPVKKEVCECSRRDYECDFGFVLSNNVCIRNQSLNYDPYAVSPDCRPGTSYYRTKGYRKIDGDMCRISYYMPYEPEMVPCPLEEPTEFILVALRDKIARIDLSDNSTVIPVQGQRNIVAIEFDMKNNCIYWADIEVDKISRQCFGNGNAQEVVVDTDLASIEGMALDWISNVLFFVDGMRKKIEAVRTDLTSQGRMRATILNSTILSKPRGIAVHPRAGYLFWTDWDRYSPSVSRSNLDGTDVKKLFTRPIVQWPNGITIDQMADRIYWVDAMEDYIASADLNGQYFRRILWNDEKVSHPFAVAVLKNKMYWDDWKAKSIFIADKDTGANIVTINDNLSGLMDLKVFAYFMQHGTNACSYKNTSCDTLCLGGPGNSFSCLCPDGFKRLNGKCMCPNGMEPAPNMTCPKQAGTCATHEFTCKNGMCIASTWRCDGNDDCGDLSDEAGCLCAPPLVACDDDAHCYLPPWRCDGDVDCVDMSDEKDCNKKNCTETQFQCANGNCIEKRWVCDGDNDCKDGSDERNCTQNIPKRPESMSCDSHAFRCHDDTNPLCIPDSWVCDGERDCPGGDDETEDRCRNSSCAPYMFRCPSGKCIFMSWVCDGENDCSDVQMSDEINCASIGHTKLIPRPSVEPPNFSNNGSCLDWMFKCENGNCLPYWWRCDGIDDCGDNSDELACGLVVPEKPIVSPEHDATKHKCSKNQFTCTPGVCIPLSWVCDKMADCADGADERSCPATTGGAARCPADSTPCADGRACVRDEQLCDGVAQCADRSDEAYCGSKHKSGGNCPSRYFQCDDGRKCLWQVKVCNGVQDCYDGSDEANCTNEAKQSQFYQFLSIGVDQTSINSSSFLISCWLAQQKSVLYSFLPSIAKVTEGVWRNMTWTNDSVYRFIDLEPYTEYNVTVYVKDSKSNKVYPSMKYVSTRTGEGMPSAPRRVSVRQQVGRRLRVLWDAPARAAGELQHYTVYYVPPLPPVETSVPAPDNHQAVSVVLEGYFKPDTNYSIWVTATNNALTSASTEICNITFDDAGDVDDVVNASVSRPTPSSVFLQWHKLRGVEGYIVETRLPFQYPKLEAIRTKDNKVNITNLPPGVKLFIDIKAFKNTTVGDPFTIPLVTEGVPDETLNVTAALLKEKRTSVQLTWSPPIGARYKNKELEYEVHYSNVMKWRTNHTRIVTKNTSVLVEGLHACETYVFSAALRGGPLAGLKEIVTRENPKAPIKNLNFAYNAKKELHIFWNANCDIIKEPIAYRLDITELTRNRVSRYELRASKNVSLAHVVQDVPLGARFNICVYASEKGAAQTCAPVRAGEVEPPRAVMAWLSPNGHIMVSWQHPDDNSSVRKHKYQILVSQKEIPEDILHPTEDIRTAEAEFSPLIMTADSTTTGPLFVSVRAVTQDGYYSDLSEVLSMEGSEAAEAASTWRAGAAWWGAGAACVCALALGAALLHAALRHRRLSHSLLRLAATPRYDSRRGQATIDHDDDDVPPIHGFSDDEPLVIA